MNESPLRHLSVRVPWHDAGWKGTICDAPHLNGACAKLPRIAELKDDKEELPVAGKSLENLSRKSWPCCVEERAAFMAPFEMHQEKRHALAKIDHNFYHFQPTIVRFPAFSAGVVPFFWLMKSNAESLRDTWGLDVDLSREPTFERHTSWVTNVGNQDALLNGFAAALRQEESICLFYAKHVPFVEGTNRILIGAGRIKNIGELTEFDRSGDGFRGMIWERPVQHSIRPEENDGFLMPYNDILQYYSENPETDLENFTAFAPSERWDEFSYCNELVTHDGAIAALLSMVNALDRTEQYFGIATKKQRQWLHDELVRLWKVRGPFPGLGAVLRAFGLSQGLYVAHAIQSQAGENTDPWPLVDAAFREPSAVLAPELVRDVNELANTWNHLSDERRTYLRLLSRFELNVDQAKCLYDTNTRKKMGWRSSDGEILQNPYRLYEISRHDPDTTHLLTIDRGVFPHDIVRNQHPLEKPMGLDSGVDPRRVRAFSVWALEEAALSGHSLQYANDVVDVIRGSTAHPECPVTWDILQASMREMEPEIVPAGPEEELAMQLKRYRDIRHMIRDKILRRVGAKRHVVEADWAGLLARKFGAPEDEEEKRAQGEKAIAISEMAESRFSVLIGSAGTGKTSALGILCNQEAIREDGILLLAPTGKARVRMQELSGGVEIRAFTVAQFLNRNGRYDAKSGRYHLSDRPRVTGYGTVIVDEASMLTEDMLGALVDAMKGVKRLILVGDPGQLPPIGAGRPFVDIVATLRPADLEGRFPRIANGYAELTIERRQVGVERQDRRLARWFSANPPGPGDDDAFSVESGETSTLRFVEWEKPEDFRQKLISILVEELSLSDSEDVRGFNRSLGSTSSGGYDYFNRTRPGSEGAAATIEDWQILSPLRGMPFGVGDINRQVHERFRAEFLKLATRQRYRKVPSPIGPEKIVYGDKVINLKNQQRDDAYPDESALHYIANGEIGVVVGQWRTKNMKRPPSTLRVEFSTQLGYTYDFYKRDFQEEGDATLELAYALTIHKAQGSQFRLVILVLPEGHPILSRELVYTALTRQQERVVVMHQGPRSLLKELAAPHRSETASRQTNLLGDCRMLEIPQAQGSVFLQEGLVHRTSHGLAVRSKSELLIAEALETAGVEFEYERPLTLAGQTRFPDFTIEDDISGRTVYWEHLGMLSKSEYRTAWERKLAWYESNGIYLANEGAEGDTILVTTTDSGEKGLDMGHIKRIISEICNG